MQRLYAYMYFMDPTINKEIKYTCGPRPILATKVWWVIRVRITQLNSSSL